MCIASNRRAVNRGELAERYVEQTIRQCGVPYHRNFVWRDAKGFPICEVDFIVPGALVEVKSTPRELSVDCFDQARRLDQLRRTYLPSDSKVMLLNPLVVDEAEWSQRVAGIEGPVLHSNCNWATYAWRSCSRFWIRRYGELLSWLIHRTSHRANPQTQQDPTDGWWNGGKVCIPVELASVARATVPEELLPALGELVVVSTDSTQQIHRAANWHYQVELFFLHAPHLPSPRTLAEALYAFSIRALPPIPASYQFKGGLVIRRHVPLYTIKCATCDRFYWRRTGYCRQCTKQGMCLRLTSPVNHRI